MIDIAWATTKRIFVPRADIPLVQASPEIRELDVNVFRKALKDLEAAAEGMPWPDTHRHVTETTLSGSTYARLVEILPPYTVEFEDGQYSVRAVGANHNILDVKINNQVSLAVQNSAGLINSPEIQYGSFDGAVWIDATSSFTGTAYPLGTPRRPVNNISDALAIAVERGFTEFRVVTDLTVTGIDVSGYRFRGVSHDHVLTVNASADVTDCAFDNLTVQGTFDGPVHIRDCFVLNVSGVSGHITSSKLLGTITQSGALHLDRCFDGIAGFGTPTVNCGGSGNSLMVAGYHGGLAIQNKTGSEEISINVDSARVVLEATVTDGDIIVRGVGQLVDNSAGATVDSSGLVNPSEVSQAVLDEPVTAHLVAGSAGAYLNEARSESGRARKQVVNRTEINFATQQLVVYDDDGTTVLYRATLKTDDGSPVAPVPGVQTKRSKPL